MKHSVGAARHAIHYMHMGSAGHVTARAEELHLRGRHNESYFEAQKAIHVDPSSGSTYDRLGVLLHRRSQDLSQDPIYRQLSSHLAHEAVQLFRHALALDPTNGETYYHLAAALGSEVERSTTEAQALFAAGALVAPRHAGLVSNHAFALIGTPGTSSNGDVLSGAALLREQTGAHGIWRVRWQHPTTLLPELFAAPRWARSSCACLLEPLERSSEAMAAEASSLLPRFALQAEGLAYPPEGWRELNVLRRCVDRSDASRAERAALSRTCEALERMLSRAGPGFELLGASFSALLPGTRLRPHCGATNGKLNMHVGLRVPSSRRGLARLRLGEPLAVTIARSRQPELTGQAEERAFYEVAWAEGEGFIWDDSFTHEVLWREPFAASAAAEAKDSPSESSASDAAAHQQSSESSASDAAAHQQPASAALPPLMPLVEAPAACAADVHAEEASDVVAAGELHNETLAAERFSNGEPRIILIVTFSHPALTGGPVCRHDQNV